MSVPGLDLPSEDASLPIFNVERVQLQFELSSDFVAAQVANNVLVIALANGRILRIDLDNAADIDDIDLPKRTTEVGLIRRLFIDPTASHLIINTTLGENFYLHTQSNQPKALARLKGVAVESVAWNPSLPTASTREILIGALDGSIYEASIEPTNEFYRREEKYVKAVYRVSEGPATGIWVGMLEGQPELRRVIIASPQKLHHFIGKIGKQTSDSSSSVFARFFENERASVLDGPEMATAAPSGLFMSPEPDPDIPKGRTQDEPTYSWLTGQGVYFGKVVQGQDLQRLGPLLLNNTRLFERSMIPPLETDAGRRRPSKEPIQGAALTQWHILMVVEGRIVAVNRLSEKVVLDQIVLDPGKGIVGLHSDPLKGTYWLFTSTEIFEIRAEDEDRDVWRIMLERQKFEEALKYAKGSAQRDAIATASGDYLINKKHFQKAAEVYGKSSKNFEDVALIFIDHNEQDALRQYLLAKLTSYPKSMVMQRMMIASWLVELFMTKLNSIDDSISSKADAMEGSASQENESQLNKTFSDFDNFVRTFKNDLDSKTTYEVIRSHGREKELLAYAKAIKDYNFIISYWVQKERWQEALEVLAKQTDPSLFYRYSSVLMNHVPGNLVDVMMRQSSVEPRKLIPALLNESGSNGSSSQDHAARYLLFCIEQRGSTDPAVHNALISIYASQKTASEAALMSYLVSQSTHDVQHYDADFALRLCIQHSRVQSCVHIFSLMGQYAAAVSLALKHDDIELASIVANKPAESNPMLRKKLWLAIAKKVIGSEGTGSIKTAIEFLKKCELLRIEDLIPFFPDFVVIDDFKEEICTALESYSRHIDMLRSEMDESASTAENIKRDIKLLDKRFALVMPGEKCRVCMMPLLSRQFFVFPSCQHGFHSDCLGKRVVEGGSLAVKTRIRELQSSIGRGTSGPRREREVRELDSLVGKECVLCNDYAIKMIEAPFLKEGDESLKEWAL